MNGTPRLRSAFPQTPQTGRTRPAQNGTPSGSSRPNSTLPTAPEADPDAAPFIPFDVIDAPNQRFYAFCLYGLLMGWRLYDWTTLMKEDTESLWNFLKWTGIDAVFLFGLPAFRIPWLVWSPFSTSLLWFLHAVFNVMLMFRIGIPLNMWFAGLAKLIYDKELAINERNVKPGDVIRNASLILGKHIVTILPEGSAVMNVDNKPFCLDASINSAYLPIQINQTKPISMEIAHVNLDSMHEDVTTLSSSSIRKMLKEALKNQKPDGKDPVTLQYQVKKPGLYRLGKVIDESKLEVQTGTSEAYVVECPLAKMAPTKPDRCRGDQSDVALEVTGVPPLKVKYRKSVKDQPREVIIQSIQPPDFASPLQKHTQNAIVKSNQDDLTWARPRTIVVPLAETLKDSGEYTYAIEQVEDGLGNNKSYKPQHETEDRRPKDKSLYQSLIVHERPRILLSGCDYQRPLQVAKGQATRLPIKFESTGKGPITNSAHTIEYLFTPEDKLSSNGDHSESSVLSKNTLKNLQIPVQVDKAGLYTLKSVSTEFCAGEVLEPASCLLQNPPQPQVSFSSEDIFDNCAGRPIGLSIALDLVGTPPFTIRYMQDGRKTKPDSKEIKGLRGQITLTPPVAGHYKYQFLDISDAVYKNIPLKETFQQDVKPSVSAQFVDRTVKEACIDAPIQYSVHLLGESPWALEYEVVHGGRRTKRKVENITSEYYDIQTENLKSGGDYSLLLASVTDGMKCKEFLKDQVQFKVRGERPKAYFGTLEGKRSAYLLEGKKIQLPLRLTGQPKWQLKYRNLETPDKIESSVISGSNANLDVTEEGTYELLEVRDNACDGVVDQSGRKFDVKWVPRPAVTVHEEQSVRFDGSKYIKAPVCEGDVDSFDLTLRGTPPFAIKYTETIQPDHGSKVGATKQIFPALNSASVEAGTAQAGLHLYEFVEVSDVNYEHDKKKHVPVAIEQRVYPRPNARFVYPGKTYSYCSREEEGEEVIPITLEGIPPFTVEINIKHHTSRPGQPRTVTIPNISSNNHELRIPHRVLELGNSVLSIRKVRDSRGCERTMDATTPRVQISVHDAPSIAPVESRTDYCVGERLSYTLTGKVPFLVYYTFNGQARKASSTDTAFRRLAELPGTFSITGVSDSASQCKANINFTSIIHPMPSVRISKGRSERVSIREGGETEILFEFTGTPPFEVTYTRSTNERPGHKSKVLETKVVYSEEYSLKVKASEEGTYEAVALKDRWCAFPSPAEGPQKGRGQKLLQY